MSRRRPVSAFSVSAFPISAFSILTSPVSRSSIISRSVAGWSLCALVSLRASAAMLAVPGEYSTIQAALDAASDGDDIIVAPGVYTVDRPISFLGKGVWLRSAEGPARTAIVMATPADPNRGSVVVFENAEPQGAVLEGFRLSGGSGIPRPLTSLGLPLVTAPAGGGVYIGTHAEPTIRGCEISGNVAHHGGGAFADVDSEPRFDDDVFRENRASGFLPAAADGLAAGGGLAAASDAFIRVTGGEFRSNTSTGYGGGLAATSGSIAIIDGVLFEENFGFAGGGAYAAGDFTVVEDSVFRGNAFANHLPFQGSTGGGLHVETSDPAHTASVTRCRFEQNRATSGGGLFAAAVNDGFRPITVTDCVFRANTAWHGGGMSTDEEGALVTIDRSRFELNSAYDHGGGLGVGYGSVVRLTASVVAGNTANIGGGVYGEDECHLIVTSSTIGHNAAMEGGGLFIDDDLEIFDSVVAGNPGGDMTAGTLVLRNSCVPVVDTTWTFVIESTAWIQDDPLFAAWPDRAEVWIDPSALSGGDGSEERPWSSFADAVAGYRIALTAGSPCIGAAAAGGDIGAPAEIAGEIVARVGVAGRRARLAAGDHALAHFNTAAMSLFGAGREATRLVGSVFGVSGDAELRDLTVTGGLSGAIATGAGAPRIADCVVARNVRSYLGAIAIGRGSDPLFERCAIFENGGIRGWGAVTSFGGGGRFESCVIAGNRSSRGAVLYAAFGTIALRNCVIAGNDASPEGFLIVTYESTVAVDHTTIADNRAGAVTACWSNGVDVAFRNSIIWRSGELPACSVVDASLISTDPEFVAPGSFDPARSIVLEALGVRFEVPESIVRLGDYRLGEGSPAIDGASAEYAVPTDFDGLPRPCGAGFDQGAFEFPDCAPDETRFRRGDVTQNGSLDITDAVALLQYLFVAGSTPPCLDAADTDDSSVLDISDAIAILGYLFLGGAAPSVPFPDCGSDPSADAIRCENPSGCA